MIQFSLLAEQLTYTYEVKHIMLLVLTSFCRSITASFFKSASTIFTLPFELARVRAVFPPCDVGDTYG